MIVILPTVFGSYYLIQERNNKNFQNEVEEAKWIASIHESYWEKFINEAVTSLQVVSMTVKTIYNDLNEMKPLLESAHRSDPRYEGLYLLDKHGYILTSSNHLLPTDIFLEADFVKETVQTKDIIIANKQFKLSNGKNVIGLSAPVIDKDNQIIALSVALLSVDYIENVMKVLTPESNLCVLNSQDEVLMKFNLQDVDKLESGEWVSLPIDNLPWKIKVKVDETPAKGVLIDNFQIILMMLFVTHVLFLFVQYVLLNRQAALVKKENEVQKLELVGTLAASTAHEIRNPLTGIKGLVQLLSEKYNHPEDQFYFSVINQEIQRINEIVSEFLILGKPTAQNLEVHDLSEIIREIYPLISTEASLKSIQLSSELPDHAILVKCTKDQMKQVILNITRNAFEAIQNGGTLSISLKEKQNKGELIIVDNGDGIEEEAMEKIFTPFFTSKETGTGLGLVVCQRILQSFGGSIELTSQVNIGTAVKITLPIAHCKQLGRA